MVCAPNALPMPPTVLSFAPYETFAVVSCSSFAQLVGNGVLGTHLDTRVILQRVNPAATILDLTLGTPLTHLVLPALSLVAGLTYSAKTAYRNEVGWGAFSRQYFARVPTELDLPALNVPGEPLGLASWPVPIQPSFIARPENRRESIEWITETGDTVRRLVHQKARRATSLVWQNLSTTERDILRPFLLERIAAVEAFQTTDHVHGTAKWFARQGALEVAQVAPGTWTVQIEADELLGVQPWTVGVSQVGGPDRIR